MAKGIVAALSEGPERPRERVGSRGLSNALRRNNWIVWSLAGAISLAAAAASVYAAILSRQVGDAVSVDLALGGPLLITAWAGVGGLILARYPRHVIGWLLLALSGVQTLQLAAFILPPLLVELGRLSPDDFSVRFADWTGLWTWILGIVLPAIFLPLYFPTGTLPTRRWRIIAAAGAVGLAGSVLGLAVGPGGEEIYANPLVFPGGEAIADMLFVLTAPPLLLAILASLASMAVRYRRANAIVRQQMKWLFVPLGLFLIYLIYNLLLPTISPEAIGRTGSDVVFPLISLTIPVAIGIAILRYRLYDIDIIIRRTLVYGALTGLLALIYFGSVTLLQGLVTAASGQNSPIVIVVSTLAIAALFSPLRRRIQEFIDRRFYRRKYDAAHTLERFAATARDEVNLEQLRAELLKTVDTAMQPENVSLWLKEQ